MDGNITTYPAVIVWCDIFVKLDLDLAVISMSAPGASAHNSVERRMSGLSLLLSGIVLPHDHYGSHLDANGITIDAELEKRNFKKAGEDVATLWSQGIIDGYETVAAYVEPIPKSQKKARFTVHDAKWRSNHVRHGKYTLVIMKCTDIGTCPTCKPVRSNVNDILPNGTFPSPVYYSQTNGNTSLGHKHKDPPPGHHYAHFAQMCIFVQLLNHSDGFYDDYNPLFSEADILKGACRECGKWFPTKKLLKDHRRSCHPRSRVNNMEDIRLRNQNNDPNELLLPNEIVFFANIQRVIDDRDGKYLAESSNGVQRWVVLDTDHPKVIEYNDNDNEEDENEDDNVQVINDSPMPRISNLDDWLRQDFIPISNMETDPLANV